VVVADSMAAVAVMVVAVAIGNPRSSRQSPLFGAGFLFFG
jgi:hypothetical protein